MKSFLRTIAFLVLWVGVYANSASASSLKIMGSDGTYLKTFDREALEALGMHSIKTKTPWTNGVTHFEGVKVKDVLEKAGISAKPITAMSFDDYAISIPAKFIDEYDPIIASRMNGQVMTMKDKGPYWIMFDLDNVSGETEIELRAFSVWHLVEFEAE